MEIRIIEFVLTVDTVILLMAVIAQMEISKKVDEIIFTIRTMHEGYSDKFDELQRNYKDVHLDITSLKGLFKMLDSKKADKRKLKAAVKEVKSEDPAQNEQTQLPIEEGETNE